MILPGIRLWYEGHSKELEEILKEAESFHLTGYARCSFPTVQNYIILDDGQVREVVEIGPSNRPTSRNLRALWGKSKIKNGLLLVYEIPPEIDYYLRRIVSRQNLIEKGTGVGQLKDLILKLRQDKETRIIDITTADGKGLLIFEKEAVAHAFFTDNAGFTFSGMESFKMLIGSIRSRKNYHVSLGSIGGERGDGTPWLPILLGGAVHTAPADELKKHMTEKFGRPYNAGEVIFTEGSKSEEIYFIISGQVNIYRKKGDIKMVLAELGEGEIFGEMAFFNQAPRSATAETLQDSVLVKIGRDEFRTLLYNSCDFRINIVKKLAQRLRKTNSEITRYWEEPRSTYLEKIIFQIINSDKNWLQEGIPPGLLMQEISNYSRMRFSEIDGLFKKLLENGKIVFVRGKVVLNEQANLP